MRIGVMGAGGIGSYLGALLTRVGADVTLICRGAHLAALRERGLKVSWPDGELTVAKIVATADPAEVEPVDVVIHAVKLYDLEQSARQMLPMIGPKTMVLPIQNGVTASAELTPIVGRERVVGGLVFINASVHEPGVVVAKSDTNTLVMGEVFGGLSGRVMLFRDLCAAAGIDARASEDIRSEQWRKFVPVAGLSAISCLSRQPIGPIREDPALRKLYRQAMQEVAGLAAAKGIPLEEDIVERMLVQAERYQYDAKVSMLEDLEGGKRLELEWLSGYVSREAARLAIPAPFHDMAYACLKPLAK
jgi:2-dehydropantoate 2-reductase